MGYGIQDFYRTAQNYGLARNNVFRIKQISNNVFLSGKDQDLYVFAKEGSIPGRTINSTKVSYKSFDYTVPLGASYPDGQNWTISFYSDNKYVIRSVLEKWSKGTFNEHGHFSTINFGATDIELVLLNVDAKLGKNINSQSRETINYTLKGCFPLSVGSIQYNMTSTGEVISVPVTLAFQYIESLNKNIK